MWPSYANPVMPPMPFAAVPPIAGQGYPPSHLSPHVARQWAAKRAWRLWRDRQQAMLQKRYYHRLTGLYHGMHFPSPLEVPYGFNQVGRLPRAPRPRDYARMPGVRIGGWNASASMARYEPSYLPPNLGQDVFPVVGSSHAPGTWFDVWARTPSSDWRRVAVVESIELAELVSSQFGDPHAPGHDSAITHHHQGTPP